MRWEVNNDPRVGDTRCISRFFFFPQRFHNTWIWLEVGKVYQRRVESYTYEFGMAIPYATWEDESLLNI